MLKSQSLLRLGFSFNGCILVKTGQMKHEDKNTVGAPSKILSEKDISEVIEMALSDHVSFSDIRNLHGLREAEVNNTVWQQRQIELSQIKCHKT